MEEHLNNILNDLEELVSNGEYKFSIKDIEYVKKSVNSFLNLQDITKIDFDILKELSDKIYELNFNNSFSILTDHINNEFYAFKFLLQEFLKRKKTNYGER